MTAKAAFWNDRAQEYSAQPVANPDAFDRKIEITRARMRPTDVVLDIGCGTGSLALRLASAGAKIHGLDVSDEMVRIAEGKARTQMVGNVAFHNGLFDDSFTEFEDGSLDGICAYSILHLIEDRPAALARMFKLLKPGGFLISSTVCVGESWMPYSMILGAMRWFGKAPYVAIITKDALAADMAGAGFVDLSQPDVGAKNTIAFIVASKPR